MKFAVAKEHRDFFRKHNRIEFEGLLPVEQRDKLLGAKATIISERLAAAGKAKTLPVDAVFKVGYDLWRGNADAKKIILQKSFAEIASELIELKPLRIAYDQLLPPLSSPSLAGSEDYREWLSSASTLNEISSVQGILCGLMLCLSQPQDAAVAAPSEVPSIFATKAGNGVFFSPDAPLNFNELVNRQGYTYLMVVYTKSVSVYLKIDSDPHTNEFRRLGYNFGDRLSDRFHPLVYI